MCRYLYYILFSIISVLLVSCDEKEEKPVTPEQEKSHAVIVYSIASNNLYYNLTQNKEDMLKGMQAVDDDNCKLLLYDVNNMISARDKAFLYSAEKNEEGAYEWKEVKSYSRDIFSTNPVRIREVINDAMEYADAVTYDLFFWSHGTGWMESEKKDGDVVTLNLPSLYSFGYDSSSQGTDEIDIDELAESLPDYKFKTIWFDACYMSGIETLYEFKDKAEYFVGYPTEIWGAGIPYNEVLPILFSSDHNLKLAGSKVYDLYNNMNRAVTVNVADLSKIDRLTQICREIYLNSNSPKDIVFQDYSRRPYGPFYDFGQYTRELAKANGRADLIPDFESALEDVTVYKAASEYDFRNSLILPENYSGISCHPFEDNGTVVNEFYKRLKWYNAVYK